MDDPAGAVFGVLADPTRRQLLAELARHSATATDLARELPISRQAVVKHLSALSGAGLLARERAGRDVRYRFTPAPLTDAMAWMAEVGGEWDDRLASLAARLQADVRSGPRDAGRPGPRDAGRPGPRDAGRPGPRDAGSP